MAEPYRTDDFKSRFEELQARHERLHEILNKHDITVDDSGKVHVKKAKKLKPSTYLWLGTLFIPVASFLLQGSLRAALAAWFIALACVAATIGIGLALKRADAQLMGKNDED